MYSKNFLIRKPLEKTNPDFAVFKIIGPYGVTEILSIGKSGGLTRECEASPENGFWFSLTDSNEVKKHFFVDEFPFGKETSSAEVTQPDVLEKTNSMSKEKTALNEVKPIQSVLPVEKDERAPGIEKVNVWSFFLALAVALSFISLIWLLRSLRV